MVSQTEQLEFPILSSPARVYAFHDDVHAEKGRFRFLARGILFVPDSYKDYLLGLMSAARDEFDFRGRIHHRGIKGAGPNPAFLVAQKWTVEYILNAVRYCPFKAFITEDRDERPFPYPGDAGYPEHAQRSLLTSFVSGLAWSFHKARQLQLLPYFDRTDNELDTLVARSLPDLLVAEVGTRRTLKQRPYPLLRVDPVEFVAADPFASGEQWGEGELLQLCDLLLGTCIDALDLPGRGPKSGRLQLTKPIMSVLAETMKVPWMQRVSVHRRFSVSLYPDNYNFAYPAYLRPHPNESLPHMGDRFLLPTDVMESLKQP